MTPPSAPFSRRQVLIGLGAAVAAPAVLGPAAGAQAAPEEPRPECLASLVQEGELSYGDLMAR